MKVVANTLPDARRTASANAVPWLVLTTVLWGGSFVFNKIGFREIPPILFYFLRFLLATLILGLASVGRLGRIDRNILAKGFIVGLALAAANLVFVLGVSGTTASRAGFLNNLFVLFVPLLSFFLWRTRVGLLNLLGVAVAVLGLWQLAHGSAEGFNQGDLLSTICSFFIAVHILAVSRFLRDEDVLLVTLVQLATVTAVGGLLTAILRPAVGEVGTASLGALAYCAVFPTIVCFTIQNARQRYVTPTQAGLIYTLDPVWSLIGSILLLGERLTPREWAGCLLILCAVAGPLLLRYLRDRNGSSSGPAGGIWHTLAGR